LGCGGCFQRRRQACGQSAAGDGYSRALEKTPSIESASFISVFISHNRPSLEFPDGWQHGPAALGRKGPVWPWLALKKAASLIDTVDLF
jgi:hypothetical protein